MPRINLLPWREAQLRERRIQFMVGLGGATLAAILIAFGAYLVFESMISAQQHRNEELRAQIRLLDKQIEEINSLEASKQQFIARMDIIEKLQRSRPAIVHVFDEIVKTLPDGTYLTAVKQSGQRLQFDGVAQSSTRVSAFMRNIDGSEWLKNPELQVVSSAGNGSSFTLFAQEASTDQPDDQPKGPAPPVRRGGR